LVTFNTNKSDVLFITNSDDLDETVELEFNNEFLNFTDSHKHLGVIFSSNAKWGLHIDSIFQSVMKKVNVLRSLKYILKRDSLLKIFQSFILPILDYASELWDGCTAFECNLLEKAQIEAARIITGLPSFSSINSLYLETGIEPLSARRKLH